MVIFVLARLCLLGHHNKTLGKYSLSVMIQLRSAWSRGVKKDGDLSGTWVSLTNFVSWSFWYNIFWLVVWNIFCFPIYWEYSSQLTFIFFRGVQTTNQYSTKRSMSNFQKLKAVNSQRIDLATTMNVISSQIPIIAVARLGIFLGLSIHRGTPIAGL